MNPAYDRDGHKVDAGIYVLDPTQKKVAKSALKAFNKKGGVKCFPLHST